MLLHGLARASQGRKLVVLHYNHALRGKKSDLDETFVKKLALGLGLEFRADRADWKDEKPSQDSCRKKRHRFFESQLRHESDRLFLAHHMDDQAETVLLRIFRGTGVKGLAAMRERDGKFSRPLLSFRKNEILLWAKNAKVRWREDHSNKNTDYERNWLRLKVIKPLEKRRGKVSEKIAALAQDAQELCEERESFQPKGVTLRTGELFLAKDFSQASLLTSFFSLHRKHAEQLSKTIRKGQGKFSFRGKDILVGAGFLYCGSKIPAPEMRQQAGHYFFRSLLGEWDSREPFLIGGGEKGKKVYQQFGIPFFLRDQVPLLKHEGKLRIALDPRSGARALSYPALCWLLQHNARVAKRSGLKQ